MTYEGLSGWRKIATELDLALGLWLCVSPRVFGIDSQPATRNHWIVGAAIAIFAAIRLSNANRLRVLGSLNIVLGVWTFVSPWYYRYTTERNSFVNSLGVGAAVFILSAYSTRRKGRLATDSTPPPVRP